MMENLDMLQLRNNNNGQCVHVMIHHWLLIVYDFIFLLESALCNLGPTLCNYVILQNPMCTMRYVAKKSSKFWTIVLDLGPWSLDFNELVVQCSCFVLFVHACWLGVWSLNYELCCVFLSLYFFCHFVGVRLVVLALPSFHGSLQPPTNFKYKFFWGALVLEIFNLASSSFGNVVFT